MNAWWPVSGLHVQGPARADNSGERVGGGQIGEESGGGEK